MNFPLNDLLSLVYPDCGPLPCAECCKAPAVETHWRDKHGVSAAVCASCQKVPMSELDFTLDRRERDEIARVVVLTAAGPHSEPEADSIRRRLRAYAAALSLGAMACGSAAPVAAPMGDASDADQAERPS